MLSNQFAEYIWQKICELNDVCRWPRECFGKSHRVLGWTKLWT